MKTSRIRHLLYLDPDVSQRLRALAEKSDVAMSSILQEAVIGWLNHRGGNELDQRFGQRLGRFTNQLDRIERDQRILVESVALFVRLTLLRDAHLPEADAGTRALAAGRYEQFIAQVGRHLAAGERTLDPTPNEKLN